MTHRISRRAFACALFVSTATLGLIAQPAAAQVYQPQKFRQVDANGIDVTWGDFVMNFVEGSIGSGEAKLDLVRDAQYRPGSYDGNSNNLNWDRIWLSYTTWPVSTTGTHINVNIGSRFESFSSTGTLPSGSTLAASGTGAGYTYTTTDGTVIDFEDPTGSTESSSNYCNGTQAQCTLLPVSITSPDGRTVGISWDVNTYYLPGTCRTLDDCDPDVVSYDTRINHVSNSFGYRVAFTYASNVGGSGAPSAEAWHQRTGASFYNDNISPTTVQSSVSYSYPSSGVTQVTDIGGRVWRFTGTGDRVTGIRRPGAASDTTTVSYNPTTGLVSAVTREGIATNYSRSVAGSTATMTVTDPLSHTKVITSDLSVGRPTSIQDENSHTTSYAYDTNGNLTRLTRPEGNYTQYTYDGRGNVTQVRQVAKSGSGLSDIVTSASYDLTCSNPVTCNEPNSTTDARANVTDYTYDGTHGGVLTITRPAPMTGATRPQTRYSYTLTSGEYRLTGASTCATGSAPSCVGTSDELKSSMSYDSNGNLTSTSRSDGSGALSATVTMTYDAVGNLLTVDGPLSGSADTARYRYDAARNLIGVTSPDPDGAGPLKMRAMRSTYTNAVLTKREIGTVNSQSDGDWTAFSAAETIDMTYDANARVTEQKLSSGSTTYALTQFSYDSLGRSDCIAVRMNPSIYGSLPSGACTLGTAGSYGNDRISQTVYDNASQVTQLKEAVGTTDAATERTLAYSNNGQVTSLIDGENNKTTYVYDGFDQLGVIQYPSSTKGSGISNSSDNEQFAYDPNGNVTARRNRNGDLLQYSYDNLNRLAVKVVPDRAGWDTYYSTGDVYYGYDNLGRMTFARFNSTGGEGVTNSYDALGRLTTSTTNLFGVSRSFTSTYDAAGNRLTLTGHAGYSAGFNYDVLGRMTYYLEGNVTPTVNIGYDNLGRRSFTNRLASSTTYQYDAVSRLSTLNQNFAGGINNSVQTFAYNPASQIISQTRDNNAFAYGGDYNVNRGYTSNGLNQHTAAGPASFTYDANGNLLSDGTNSYTHDVENRLVQVPGTTPTSLLYDPLGRLWMVNKGSSTTVFAYYGVDASPVREYDGSGTTLHSYVYGPGTDEVLVDYQDSPAWVRRFPHADERGSSVALSDSSGNEIAINTYDEYGIPGSGNAGRFQYTGQMWLAEIGMQYSKARMYSPTLGRFMQTDPIGYRDGPNWYAYVHNNPINALDPLGLNDDIVITGHRLNFLQEILLGELVSAQGPQPLNGGMFEIIADGGSGGDPTQCAQGLKQANQDVAAVNRAKAAWNTLASAAGAAGIDPALLGAVGVRESGFGAPGTSHEQDGAGVGVGVFQLTVAPGSGVTDAQASNLGTASQIAANHLAGDMGMLAARFPSFTPTQLIQATAAAYNMGLGKNFANFSGNPTTIDVGTAHGNYGSSVVNLMACFGGT